MTPECEYGIAEDFQDALQGAVLARAAVQDIERHIGPESRQDGGDIASDIDPADPIALPLQRLRAGVSGSQRNLTFG